MKRSCACLFLCLFTALLQAGERNSAFLCSYQVLQAKTALSKPYDFFHIKNYRGRSMYYAEYSMVGARFRAARVFVSADAANWFESRPDAAICPAEPGIDPAFSGLLAESELKWRSELPAPGKELGPSVVGAMRLYNLGQVDMVSEESQDIEKSPMPGCVSLFAPAALLDTFYSCESLYVRVALYDGLGGGAANAWLLAFQVKVECFPGESMALEGLKGSHRDKAKALLHALWPEYPEVKDSVPAIKPDALPFLRLSLAQTLVADIMAFYRSEDCLVEILDAEGSIAKTGVFPVAYAMESAQAINLLYGDTRDPYLNAFLNMCAAHQSPALRHAVMESETRAMGKAAYISDCEISADEGKALARAALSYAFWGLEYSYPAKGAGELCPMWNVYEENQKALDAWLDAPAGQNRLDLPAEVKTQRIKIGGLEINSPFTSLGNPLPYLAGGRDNPRSFNYKLREQLRAMRQAYEKGTTRVFPSTRAFARVDEKTLAAYTRDPVMAPSQDGTPLQEGLRYYFNIEDGTDKKILKTYAWVKGQYQSGKKAMRPFSVDRSIIAKGVLCQAGVDVAGFLLGCMAMALPGAYPNLGELDPLGIMRGYFDSAQSIPFLDWDNVKKPGYSTLQNLSKARLSRASLEKASFILPDIGSLRPGDIVMHGGERDEAAYADPGNDCVAAGIVVFIDGEAPRSTRVEAEEAVFLVYLSADEGQVRYDSLAAFGQKNGYCLRRLLKGSKSGNGLSQQDWDVMASHMNHGVCYFLDPTGRERLRQHWIPNTGEFLCFRLALAIHDALDKEMDMAQKSLADIGEPRLDPPLDRMLGGLEEAAYLDRNRGLGFTLMVSKDQEGVDARLVAILVPKADEPGKYSIAEDPGGILDKDGFLTKGWSWEARFSSGQRRYLLSVKDEGGEYPYFLIRPLIGAIFPGDDLQFSISLYDRDRVKPRLLGCPGRHDYLAVYDKKMLWRANLYISDKEADWNELNPWNAPPPGATKVLSRQVEKGLVAPPAWWSPEWGYNEWNRQCLDIPRFKGLSELSPGDGGQVVRGFSFATCILGAPSLCHNAVAYSYPVHPFEPPNLDGLRGGAGSMDSPFDFVKKLAFQAGHLAWCYSFQAYRYFAPQEPKVAALRTLNDFKSLSNFQSYVSLPLNNTEEYALENRKLEWRDIPSIKNFIFSAYQGRMPHMGSWFNYASLVPPKPSGLDYTPAFLPGLGSFFVYPDKRRKAPKGLDPDAFSLARHIIEAGTDCVGFAQRAASYLGNVYKWADLTPGWTECANAAGTDNIYEALRSYGQQRGYPICAADTKRSGMTKQSTCLASFGYGPACDFPSHLRDDIDSQRQLSRVVPGDVVYFDRDGIMHIAIVNAIDYDEGLNLSNIWLIEATIMSRQDGEGAHVCQVINHRDLCHFYCLSDTSSNQYQKYWIVRLHVGVGQ